MTTNSINYVHTVEDCPICGSELAQTNFFSNMAHSCGKESKRTFSVWVRYCTGCEYFDGNVQQITWNTN